MGTYRANKLQAAAAYEITKFKFIAKEDVVEVITKATDLTEFGSPMYPKHKWTLGDIECSKFSKEESTAALIPLEDFQDIPLYKLVQRDGKAYVLILKVCPDSKVIAGSNSGAGVYFETSFSKAMTYYTTSGIPLDWTDTQEITGDLNEKTYTPNDSDYSTVGTRILR